MALRHAIVALLGALGAAWIGRPRELRLPMPAGLAVAPIPEHLQPRPQLLEGAFATNTLLREHAQRLFEGQVRGSESVAVDQNGMLWMLDKWGYVFTATPNGSAPGSYTLTQPPVAYVGPGRPLGFHVDAEGSLLACDSTKGLIRLDTGGALQVLANRVSPDSPLQPGSLITYANDLDIASDGSVLFSDCSDVPVALNRHPSEGGWFDTMRSYLLAFWRGVPTGRLLKYDPATRATHVLADGFWYANGVALSADETWAAVVETCSMRVWRVWLKGAKAGSREVLIDTLPGWPDGISRASDGGFWLALIAPDLPLGRALLPHPLLRWAVAWLPPSWVPSAPSWGAVVKLSPQGSVERVLLDPPGPGNRIGTVSAVTEQGGRLFLGNLGGDYVSVVDLSSVGL